MMNPYQKVASGMVAKYPNLDGPSARPRRFRPRPKMMYPSFPPHRAFPPRKKLWT